MEKSRKRSEILPPQPAHERGAGERPGAWLFTMLPARWRPGGETWEMVTAVLEATESSGWFSTVVSLPLSSKVPLIRILMSMILLA